MHSINIHKSDGYSTMGCFVVFSAHPLLLYNARSFQGDGGVGQPQSTPRQCSPHTEPYVLRIIYIPCTLRIVAHLTPYVCIELSALDPYPTKPRIMFNKDGTFKITVFSDLHYGENPWDAWGPQQDVNSTELMNIVLASEKPDYV